MIFRASLDGLEGRVNTGLFRDAVRPIVDGRFARRHRSRDPELTPKHYPTGVGPHVSLCRRTDARQYTSRVNSEQVLRHLGDGGVPHDGAQISLSSIRGRSSHLRCDGARWCSQDRRPYNPRIRFRVGCWPTQQRSPPTHPVGCVRGQCSVLRARGGRQKRPSTRITGRRSCTR